MQEMDNLSATFIEAPSEPAVLEYFRQSCLCSLSFPELGLREREISRPAARTCDWLSEHSDYAAWLTKQRGWLWIIGKSGTGKSTLLRRVKTLQQDRNTSIVASFFFNGRGVDLQRNAVGLFRSLLHQILPQIPEKLMALARVLYGNSDPLGFVGKTWVWHDGELRDLLRECIRYAAARHPVQIFIDGVDEGGEELAHDLIGYFSSVNADLKNDAARPFQICLSRREARTCPVKVGSMICVQEKNSGGIMAYIDAELDGVTGSAIITPHLKEYICKASQGNFQWTSLVVSQVLDLLKKGESRVVIEDATSRLPSGLRELYGHLLSKIQSKDVSRALQLMTLLCFARRTLCFAELRCAITVGFFPGEDGQMDVDPRPADYMANRLYDLSCGLVEVRFDIRPEIDESYWSTLDEESSSFDSDFIDMQPDKTVVQFTHQSVAEYLTEVGLRTLAGPGPLNVVGMAHSRIAEMCMQYMTSEDACHRIGMFGDLFRNKPERYLPFLSYAIEFWASHGSEAEKHGVSQTEILRTFMAPSSKKTREWVEHCTFFERSSARRPNLQTCLQAAAHFNFPLSVREFRYAGSLLSHTTAGDENFKDMPLYLAVSEGHYRATRILLEDGPKFSKHSEYNLLSVAAESPSTGDDQLVQLLLGHGADIDACDIQYCRPLVAAVKSRNLAVATFLLDEGAALNALCPRHGPNLGSAVKYEKEAMMTYLLSKGFTNSYMRHSRRWNDDETLYLAKRYQSTVEMIQLLLDRGIIIHTDPPNIIVGSPIHCAFQALFLTSLIFCSADYSFPQPGLIETFCDGEGLDPYDQKILQIALARRYGLIHTLAGPAYLLNITFEVGLWNQAAMGLVSSTQREEDSRTPTPGRPHQNLLIRG